MKAKLLILIVTIIGCSLSHAQNIGIGQSSPKAPLDVKGGVTVGAPYSGSATSTNGAIIKGQVGIGNSNPNSNAILDLTNIVNKGMLLPRITTAAEVSMGAPVNGLVFYNTTTDCVDVYSGGNWQPIYCPCPALTSPAVAGATSVCAGSSNVYTVASVSGVSSYTWSVSGTATSANIVASSGNSVTVTAPSSGPYYVTCTLADACGNTVSGNTSVSIGTPGTPSFGGDLTSVNEGDALSAYGVSATNATSYSWSSIGGSWTQSATTGSSINLTPPPTSAGLAAGGTYTITATATNTCGSTSASLTITVHGSQTFAYTGTNQTATIPASGRNITTLTVTAAGGQGGYYYDQNWGADYATASYIPGQGEVVTCNLTVTANQVLNLQVGQAGGTPTSATSVGAGGNGGYITAGVGDASGGAGSYSSVSLSSGGGGGGATDIRTGGTALTNRVIVAGGGGGDADGPQSYNCNVSAGYDDYSNPGGQGGSCTGTGAVAGGAFSTGVYGRGGGTSSGGAAVSGSGSVYYSTISCIAGTYNASSCATYNTSGAGAITTISTGGTGALGLSSTSSSTSCSGLKYFGGGGGGGGYYGASGGVGAGGGGGSSYLSSSGITFTSSSVNPSTVVTGAVNGYITLAW